MVCWHELHAKHTVGTSEQHTVGTSETVLPPSSHVNDLREARTLSALGLSGKWLGRAASSSHLVLNGLIPLLDLSLESLDVFLQGLDDPLQLHLLRLEDLDVIGTLFDLLLQAAELRKQTATVRTPGASEWISISPPLGVKRPHHSTSMGFGE